MLNFVRHYNHLVLYTYMSSPNSSTIVHQSADTRQLVAELMWYLAFCRVPDGRLLCVSPNNQHLASNIQFFFEQLSATQTTEITLFNCPSFALLADLSVQKQHFTGVIADYSGASISAKWQNNLEHFFGIQFVNTLPPYLIYFLYNILLLSPNAYLAALLPNTWLNSAVGQQVQQLLLDRFEVVALISSTAEHWHSTQQGVHVLVLREQTNEVLRNQHLSKFVYCNQALSSIVNGIDMAHWVQQIVGCKQSTQNNNYKITCVSQFMLRVNPYRWIQYLTAPNIYWDLLKRGRSKFKPLEQIAQIHEGITTGCNRFFMLHDITEKMLLEEQGLLLSGSLLASIKNVPTDAQTIKALVAKNLRVVQNGWNEKWLIETACLQTLMSIAHTKFLLLTIDTHTLSNTQKRYPHTAQYVVWGEKRNIATRPIVKQRNPWYSIVMPPIPNLYMPKQVLTYANIYQTKYFVDNNYVAISLQNAEQAAKIAQYGQSTIGILMQYTLLMCNTNNNNNNKLAQLNAPLLGNYQIPQQLPNTPNFLLPFGDEEDWQTGKINLNKDTPIDLANINPKRLSYDTEVLRLLGIINPKERRQLLSHLYATTANIIQHQLAKPDSEVTKLPPEDPHAQHLKQLKWQIHEQQIAPQKNFQFVRYLQTLIANITPKPSKQARLLSAYWQLTFGKRYNPRKIWSDEQHQLF